MDDPNRNAGAAAEHASEAGRQFRDGQGADRGPEVLACPDRGVAEKSGQDPKPVRGDPTARRLRARSLAAETPLTQERLKELLHYDPATGVFTWAIDRVGHGKWGREGSLAGDTSRTSQYRIICIDYRRYRAHRLAFLYMTGSMPAEVDHIDGDKKNNRFENLRPCSRSENSANRGKLTNNTSGYKGAYWDKSRKRWFSQICVNGKIRHIGRFDTAEEAAAAYYRAAQRYFGEFARSA